MLNEDEEGADGVKKPQVYGSEMKPTHIQSFCINASQQQYSYYPQLDAMKKAEPPKVTSLIDADPSTLTTDQRFQRDIEIQ